MRFADCLIVVFIAVETLLFDDVLASTRRGLVKPVYEIESAELLFDEFIKTHNKIYHDDGEKNLRFQIFKDNIVKINKLNALRSNELSSFAINQFADKTEDEFLQFAGGVFGTLNYSSPCESITMDTNEAPESYDWSTSQYMTPVGNQASCGSCYSFSAVGNIEFQYARKHNQPFSFSEQQILDCDKQTNGCNGGFPEKAFDYVRQTGGIELEKDYMYNAHVGQCRFDVSKVRAKVVGCKNIVIHREDEMKEALYKFGPLSILMTVNEEFQLRHTGVFQTPCTNANFKGRHALLLVGYGTDDGVPYWKLKNSWGTTWGEQGYDRIIRGQNLCSITESLTTAIVE